VQQAGKDLGRDEFLRMLIAQLENQDPLNPQEATEFTAQLATFTSLEQLLAMRQSIDKLVEAQTASGGAGADDTLRALGLIGHTVVAEGSQLEIGASGQAVPPLAFELDGHATAASIEVRTASGALVRQIELGRTNQGRHELGWDGRDLEGRELPPGTYRFDVTASYGSAAVTARPLMTGRVTGAPLQGSSPSVFVGNLLVPLADVVEVRQSEASSEAGS
jgi:flagellar basal-body rod modification protein FlgD